MRKEIRNHWDPSKGNYYPRQPDGAGRKSYDIRYSYSGIDFKGTLREQLPSARYVYRAEISAISPLTGKPVKDGKGNVVMRSFWAGETDLNELLDVVHTKQVLHRNQPVSGADTAHEVSGGESKGVGDAGGSR